ncbi:HlyD family secretion protein [Leeuwenhoekiella marinoflava]|uniref:HlyD family secretion protein n=1 Tax=Leeuwenhoekiella marinoflava TaxID=988 RepID=UPI00300396C0
MAFKINLLSFSEYNIQKLTSKKKVKNISLYLLIVLLIIAFLCSLPFIKIDISSQSRGIVRSYLEPIPLTSLSGGQILKVSLANNLNVKKGDTLLRLVQNDLQVQQSLNDTLTNDYLDLYSDYTSLLQNNIHTLQTTTVKQIWAEYTMRHQELQNDIDESKNNYDRYKKLFEKGVVAAAEYDTYSFELKSATNRLNSFKSQQRATWANRKRELQEELNRFENNQDQLKVQANNYVLTAPISGTLENFSGLQNGSFINPGQVVATLSPNDSLVVENTVSPNDIGLLKKGQKVKYQIDAFNYNQWGFLEGKIVDIDKNITIQEGSAFFKVRTSLPVKEIALASGYAAPISKGMTLTTRFFIVRRSLYDLLFDKVDDWLNPKIIKF